MREMSQAVTEELQLAAAVTYRGNFYPVHQLMLDTWHPSEFDPSHVKLSVALSTSKSTMSEKSNLVSSFREVCTKLSIYMLLFFLSKVRSDTNILHFKYHLEGPGKMLRRARFGTQASIWHVTFGMCYNSGPKVATFSPWELKPAGLSSWELPCCILDPESALRMCSFMYRLLPHTQLWCHVLSYKHVFTNS